MKYTKFSSLVLAASMFLMSCETEMVDKLDDFNLANGGYIRTVSPLTNNFTISKANLTGTKMEAILEAVTPNKGANFASYDLTIQFVDATPANGNKSTTATAFRSLAASVFTADAATGYPRHTLIITGTDALNAAKLTAADISAGDKFTVTGVMKLNDGRTFTAANTGANITGGAFYNAPFVYNLNVGN